VSDSTSSSPVLIVNGVTTHFGGSGLQALKSWQNSFSGGPVGCTTWHVAPEPSKNFNRKVYNLFLGLLFFPGTVFRFLRSPIFEMLYKISPISIIQLWWRISKSTPSYVVFSHHSAFYLAFFVPWRKRCLVIQDLLCARAASMGASRRAKRRILGIELAVYQRCPRLFVLSYNEARILRRFLPDVQIELVSCYDPDVQRECPPAVYDAEEIAIVSDWRRQENCHGLRKFFSSGNGSIKSSAGIRFSIWGFGDNPLSGTPPAQGDSRFVFHGPYQSYADVKEGIALVPIYQGAGIKLKTLEGFRHRRVVVGTRGAFIGLPPIMLRNISLRVRTPDDFDQLPALLMHNRLPDEFAAFWAAYSKHYAPLAQMFCRQPTPR
jgi:hypothetical protein